VTSSRPQFDSARRTSFCWEVQNVRTVRTDTLTARRRIWPYLRWRSSWLFTARRDDARRVRVEALQSVW